MNEKYLLIPHIRIHNANALSSPYTIGFPAMTAWLGAAHALQRKLNQQGISASFDAAGVVCHDFDLQTYKGPGDYEFSIIGTANPLDKNGSRPAFIEEARCHLDVSLVIQYSGVNKLQEPEFIAQLTHCLHSQMKIAGGDITQFDTPQTFREFGLLKPRLMPGYALIERRDLMIEAMENGQDALDALLDYLAIHHHCEQYERGDETIVSWSSQRKRTGANQERGWIVPIATGYQGISELGFAQNQRDPDTSHRFAEAVVTLGEFKMAYRFDDIEALLWRYQYQPDHNLYLCQQNPQDLNQQFLHDGF